VVAGAAAPTDRLRLLAHELIESDAAKREVARAELNWWVTAAERSLEHFTPA
jgi:hypothetical protein